MGYSYKYTGALELKTEESFLDDVCGIFDNCDFGDLKDCIYPWAIEHGSSTYHHINWEGEYYRNQDDILQKIISLPSVKDVFGHFFYQGEDAGNIGFVHVVNARVVETPIDHEKLALLLSCELGKPNKLPMTSKLLC